MPESQPFASDVDVCGTESVFVQVTVVPAETVSASGTKAAVPSPAAPVGIETEDDGPAVAVGGVDVGVGDGAVDE